MAGAARSANEHCPCSCSRPARAVRRRGARGSGVRGAAAPRGCGAVGGRLPARAVLGRPGGAVGRHTRPALARGGARLVAALTCSAPQAPCARCSSSSALAARPQVHNFALPKPREGGRLQAGALALRDVARAEAPPQVGPAALFPGILAITQSAKLGSAVVTRAASTARCDPATGLARPHAALGRGARGQRGAGGAGRRAASGAPAAAAAGGAAAGPGHRDQGARPRVRAAQPNAVCPRCMSTCVDERLKAAASPHSLCRIVHHRCLCHDPSGRHHAALLEASEREASGGERPPYASLGPQRCWARARGQERFNAEFEALRQRKRGCLEQLRAAQRRMAELAAQAAALGGGLGADGELAFAALQDCEQPDSVLTVQARGRRRRAHAVHMSWLG